MSTTSTELIKLLEAAVAQPIELNASGRVTFRTVDDVSITFEIASPSDTEEEEESPPVEDFYLVSTVATLPEDPAARIDVMSLALGFNRALLAMQFSIALGNPSEGQPQALLLGYTGSLRTVEENGLTEVLGRFSSTAAYLKIELNNLNEE